MAEQNLYAIKNWCLKEIRIKKKAIILAAERIEDLTYKLEKICEQIEKIEKLKKK